MPDDPLAPKLNARTLHHVLGEMRSRAQTNGRVHRPSKHQPAQPNKFCDVCRKVWRDDAILAGDEMKPKTCQECQTELAQGGVAVIAPSGEYMFVWGAGVVDLPQKNNVSQEEYDKIVEWAKNNPKPEEP